LWSNYYNERKKLEEKNNGNSNELEVFHGPSVTDPEMIYNGEEGFDMRFCAEGYWGQGIYFATEASYSNGYAFVAENNLKKMFLVKLLAGESISLGRNDSLRLPPPKPSSTSSLNFTVDRYDSVNGIEKMDCLVYVVYANWRAYPAYLITYEDSNTDEGV